MDLTFPKPLYHYLCQSSKHWGGFQVGRSEAPAAWRPTKCGVLMRL